MDKLDNIGHIGQNGRLIELIGQNGQLIGQSIWQIVRLIEQNVQLNG